MKRVRYFETRKGAAAQSDGWGFMVVLWLACLCLWAYVAAIFAVFGGLE